MSPDDLKLFKEWGVPLPTRDAHGTEDDIRQNLKSVKPTNWRMEGNMLKADTELGELAQPLPTNLILTGTDDQGLPTFKQI